MRRSSGSSSGWEFCAFHSLIAPHTCMSHSSFGSAQKSLPRMDVAVGCLFSSTPLAPDFQSFLPFVFPPTFSGEVEVGGALIVLGMPANVCGFIGRCKEDE